MSWPTTNDPRTEFVTTRFTVSEASDLDWLIGRVGAKNRSAALRGAVDRVIAAERKREAREKKANDTVRALADLAETGSAETGEE